jgi:hypothetical protein
MKLTAFGRVNFATRRNTSGATPLCLNDERLQIQAARTEFRNLPTSVSIAPRRLIRCQQRR